MKKGNYFIWVSDCYSNTGEGKLAINFIKKLTILNNKSFYIKSPKKKFNNLNSFIKKASKNNFYKSNFSFFYRYTIFLRGLFNLWVNYISGKKVVYLNYLPLWNFLIFILSPPNTIFGPITGSIYKINKNNYFNDLIRQYLFPIFFNISIFFLKIRKSKYFFSTSLLQPIIKKKKLSYLCDVQLLSFKPLKHRHKKKYDLFIYNRKHHNKIILNFEKIFSDKKFKNFKMISLGEKINLPNFKNLGFIAHDKVQFYLNKSKFTIISSENIYSFFFLDSLAADATPLFNKKINFNNSVIDIKNNNQLNYDDDKKFTKKIFFILNNKIITCKPKLNSTYIKNISIKFDYFIKKLF